MLRNFHKNMSNIFDLNIQGKFLKILPIKLLLVYDICNDNF